MQAGMGVAQGRGRDALTRVDPREDSVVPVSDSAVGTCSGDPAGELGTGAQEGTPAGAPREPLVGPVQTTAPRALGSRPQVQTSGMQDALSPPNQSEN